MTVTGAGPRQPARRMKYAADIGRRERHLILEAPPRGAAIEG
jgi:hypothetical protein